MTLKLKSGNLIRFHGDALAGPDWDQKIVLYRLDDTDKADIWNPEQIFLFLKLGSRCVAGRGYGIQISVLTPRGVSTRPLWETIDPLEKQIEVLT